MISSTGARSEDASLLDRQAAWPGAALVVIDDETGTAEANGAARHLLGLRPGTLSQDEARGAVAALASRSTVADAFVALRDVLFGPEGAGRHDWVWTFPSSPTDLRVRSWPLDGDSPGRCWQFQDVSAGVQTPERQDDPISEPHEYEQRRRRLDEYSADVVVAARLGVIEWVAPSVTGLLGWEPADLQGRRFAELVHPDDQAIVGVTESGLDRGETGADEIRLRTAAGGYRWITSRVRRLPESDVSGFDTVATWRDAESEHRERSRLAEREAAYRTLVEHSPDVVFHALAGVIVWISPNVGDLLGHRCDALIGRLVRDLWDPADALVAAALDAETGEGRTGRATLRVRRADGTTAWVDAALQPTDDAAGVDGVVGLLRDATARVTAENALADSEARMRLLAENAADIVVLVDPDGRFAWASPSVPLFTGWSVEQWLAMDPAGRLHPDDVHPAWQAVRAVGNGKPGTNLEVRLRHADGTYRWWSGTLRRTAHLVAPGPLVLALSDVDDEVRGREALRFEQARREAAIGSMLDPYVLLAAVRDDEGRIVDFEFVDANPAACAYNAMSYEELMGRRLLELFPAHAATGLFESYAAVVETGEPLVLDDFVYDNEIRAGSRHYDIRAVRVGDAISYTWRDVTDRVQAAQDLADSQDRYRMLAENASDVVYLVGEDRRVRWISPSVTGVLGWSPDELVGTSMAALAHPGDLATVAAARSSDGHAPPGAATRIRCKDGSYRWMSFRVTPISADEDHGPAAVVALRDVDELVEARRQAERDEELLRVTVDALADPQVLMEAVRDRDGRVADFRFLDTNQAACDILGRSRQDLLAESLLQVIPDVEAVGLLARYAEVVDYGDRVTIEDFPSAMSGEPRRYTIRAAPAQDDRVSLTTRDVTERYEAATRLAESEARFRVLAEQSSDVVVLEQDEVMTWVSPVLTSMLGWLAAAWVGRRIEEFAHPDDLSVIRLERERARGGSRPNAVGRFRVRAVDGGYHWIEYHAAETAEGLPHAVVITFRTIDDEVAREQALEERARRDDLTGALRRDGLLAHLAALRSRPRDRRQNLETGGVALLYVDLDRFKAVNDTFGHLAGDTVLQAVAERLHASVRASDLVARTGGDEFVVLLDGVGDLAEATDIAEKVRARVALPIEVPDGAAAHITISVGVTLWDPADLDADLLERADRAMYAAKQAGRDRVVAIGGDG